MDEDDSQDELINRASINKGKRAAAWTISDDSDDDGSDDMESQSEDDEDGPLDEEDEGDDNEDEDEDEEEDDDVPKEEGACAGTSAEAEVSSDEEAEKCAICLHSFNRQPVATPENCEHYFCLDCILEWSKNANSCPIDRTSFKVIYLRTCFGGKVQKAITVQKPAKQREEETVDVDLEETSCEVCGGSDREDRLLLCDGCDAGYHMECLTPPLDAVPVEEWFCPECEANNRQSRASAAETSDADSLPSTARRASSHTRTQVGQTRAIARTQHSERVRANVNRHRITQARTQEFAPTYLIRSTWLDETINAVVAGLNTAEYVRDLTSRPSSRRCKSRKVRRRQTSKSIKAKAAGKGVKRRKRRVRRTKSRRKPVLKKSLNARYRIANNLGIVKDKKSSSLPTVYRPSESTLSNMRADIGAASLSIYGDPFDLDPFTDREDEERSHDSALLEAKRRGISRSAFRSHQPVARPVGLSRRSESIPQVTSVVEATPVPDLLGSILTGQSMLLMDSSDVVINRDGSLKATKPLSLTNTISSHSRSSSSGDGGPLNNPDSQLDSMDRLGSFEGPMNTHVSQSSSLLNLPEGSPLSPIDTSFHHAPSRGNAFSHEVNRPNQRFSNPITNGVRDRRDSSSSESKASSQSHSVKAPIKPMWEDVSVLPRIPRIKKENISASTVNDRNSLPETGISKLAGDKGHRLSVDQQNGRTDGPRNRPDGAGSSSGFSSSFSSSSSSSSPASHTNHQRFSSSSSSSSVSFRINSSGNSWHSRRLNISSPTPSGSSLQEHSSKKEEDEKRRQMRRDKQKLLASRSKETSIYDPFNPTESDSGSSDGESGGTNMECNSRLQQEPANLKGKVLSRSRWDSKQVKRESHSEDIQTHSAQGSSAQPQSSKGNSTFKKGSIFSQYETQTPSRTTIKKEPESDEDVIKSETIDDTQQVEERIHFIKTESMTEDPVPESYVPLSDDSSSAKASSSPAKESHIMEIKSDFHVSQSEDSASETMDYLVHSISTERAKKQSSPKHEGEEKEKDKTKSSRRSQSKERKRTLRTSDSSLSKSPDKTSKKRRRRSLSKDEKRTRSSSTSSSREQSRTKKHKKQSKEKNEDKDVKTNSSKDKRRDQSHTKSRSKSRSRSKSKERRRGRSRSREKRKNESHHQSKSRSRSKDRRQSRSTSRSRDRRESRSTSRSRDRKRSRSTSRPRDRRKNEPRHQSRSRSRSKDGRKSRSTSRSRDRRKNESRHESRSRSRSRGRRKSRSTSRSRERKKREPRHPSRSRSRSRDGRTRESHQSSRDKEEPRSKDKKKHRSSSREKKIREDPTPVKTQKSSDTSRSAKDKQTFDTSKSSVKHTKSSDSSKSSTKVSKSSDSSKSSVKVTKPSDSSKLSLKDAKPSDSSKSSLKNAKPSDSRKSSLKDAKPSDSRKSSLKDAKPSDSSESFLKDAKPSDSSKSFLKDAKPSDSSKYFLKDAKLLDCTKLLVKDTKPSDTNRPSVKDKPPTESSRSSDKDEILAKVKRNNDNSTVETDNVTKTNKPDNSSPITYSVVKKEPTESKKEEMTVDKKDKPKKEIKKEKIAMLDMFEGSPTSNVNKEEHMEIPISVIEAWCEEDMHSIKTEMCKPDEAEPKSPDEKPLVSDCSFDDDLHTIATPSPPQDSPDRKTEGQNISVKHEATHQSSDSDEDFNVDVMLDNLALVKTKLNEQTEETVKQNKDEKSEGEPAPLGTKSKSQVKRVTWNIEEPVGPQPEKSSSKVALYKLKLKQEGIRRPSASLSYQDFTGTGSDDDLTMSKDPERSCDSAQGLGDDGDPVKKDKTYLKKLHMQERAVEEVKLAIKPFYQNREITKDEYKDILRKAVQKVCHSKSGEINPVKVGNLVKAYVDKYKHARKYNRSTDSP